jgi:hypothetical protein
VKAARRPAEATAEEAFEAVAAGAAWRRSARVRTRACAVAAASNLRRPNNAVRWRPVGRRTSRVDRVSSLAGPSCLLNRSARSHTLWAAFHGPLDGSLDHLQRNARGGGVAALRDAMRPWGAATLADLVDVSVRNRKVVPSALAQQCTPRRWIGRPWSRARPGTPASVVPEGEWAGVSRARHNTAAAVAP